MLATIDTAKTSATTQVESHFDLESVVQRVRASKEKTEAEDHAIGFKEGREFGIEYADYDFFISLSKLENHSNQITISDLTDATGLSSDELFGDEEDITDSRAAGFLDGVMDIWVEVERQV